jgi:hypothetical protein
MVSTREISDEEGEKPGDPERGCFLESRVDDREGRGGSEETVCAFEGR